MAKNAVIDKDVLRWGGDHSVELTREYNVIFTVGKYPGKDPTEEHDLPQRAFDVDVARHCKANDCDLFTGDQTAYVHFFEADIKTIQISKHDWYKRGDKPVYQVKIID